MTARDPEVAVSREGDAAVVRLSGEWCLRDGLRPRGEVERALRASPPPRVLRVEAAGV